MTINTIDNSLPPHIAELVEAGALFVINHSGGKDSQAMYGWLARQLPADQVVVVHADLAEVEWAGVQDHIRSQIDGRELHVVKAYQERSFFDMVELRHQKLQAEARDVAPWPSAAQRQCTSDLKRDPIAKFIRRHSKAAGRPLVVNCLGLRAEESSDRAERAAFSTTTRLCTRSRTVVEWLPIQAWTLAEVWQAIADSGQVRHWAYDKGMSRLSCAFCILASKSDLTIAAQENPALYAKYVALEKRTGYTMRAGASLEQITGIEAEVDETDRPAAVPQTAERQVVLGTPINPAELLDTLAGYSFCVSYASRQKLGGQLDRIIELVNADPRAFLLIDNGAFTHWRRGGAMTDDYIADFEAWAQAIMARCPKAVAVLPDVIDGAVEDNWRLVLASRLERRRAMPIWHLHEPLEYLAHMIEAGFSFVGFGSSGEYASGQGPEWSARIEAALALVDDMTAPGNAAGRVRPHVHMMRCQAALDRFPFNSADSTNVAVNHNRYAATHNGHRARFLADRIRDRVIAAGPAPIGRDIWVELAASA